MMRSCFTLVVLVSLCLSGIQARSGLDLLERMLNAMYQTEKRALTRSDNRCGPNYPAANGEAAECPYRCCSSTGWCGESDAHCTCSGCTDYRVAARQDGRCGPNYPYNGKAGECPGRCCSSSGWCGDSSNYCDCGGCKDY